MLQVSHPRRRAITLVFLMLCTVAASALRADTYGDKRDPNGIQQTLTDMVVTATFADGCYLQKENRAWGIRAVGSGQYPEPGEKVTVTAVVQTDLHGERYLDVSDGDLTGTGDIAPFGVTNRSLGGGNWNYDQPSGAGQMGVTGGSGLNNIGLLVRTTGACARVDDHTFTINDGSGVNPTCETPPGIMVNPAWRYVAATGIISIRKSGETYNRLLRVTGVDPILSDASEGITGRWESTNTSGPASGVIGMLLVQQGGEVRGAVRGWPITNGQMTGSVFTCTLAVPDVGNIISSLTLDGDTLSGTYTIEGTTDSLPITFHKLSSEPMSPYAGRPHVLTASCTGSSIDVTWDRPINGWDYDIHNSYGQSIVSDWSDFGNSYDPATHTFHIALDPATPFVGGEQYTIYLDSGDSIDWHDPYGAAAWDDPDLYYSFEYSVGGALLRKIVFTGTDSAGNTNTGEPVTPGIGHMYVTKTDSQVQSQGFAGPPPDFISVGSPTIIPADTSVGTTFMHVGESNGIQVTTEVTVDSISETAVTPAGVFYQCLRTTETNTYADFEGYVGLSGAAVVSRTRWFAPGVGPVKYEATYMRADSSTYVNSGLLQFYSLTGSPSGTDWWPLDVYSMWVFRESHLDYSTTWTVIPYSSGAEEPPPPPPI